MNDNSSAQTILPMVIPSLSKEIEITSSSSTNEPVKGIEKSTMIEKESLTPYGWPCVRGLFRFLTELINSYDKSVCFFAHSSIDGFSPALFFKETIPNI